jgi:hypothetical protein
VGSNPTGRAIIQRSSSTENTLDSKLWAVSSAVRAPVLHTGGQRSKSSTAHHSKGQFSFRKFTKYSLDKFLAFQPDGFSIKTIEFYYYAFNNFVGYSLGPEGAISYLRSHTCHDGKKVLSDPFNMVI